MRVRLFDAREIAGGASGRNGGFALRGGAAPYPVLAESIGDDATAALWEWTEAELVELAVLAGDAYRPTGSLRLAVDDEEWKAELPQIQEWFEKFGDQLPTVLWTELDGLRARLGG